MVVTTAPCCLLAAPFIFLAAALQYAQGGICWSSVSENGRCTEMLAQQMSRDQCCGDFPGAATAWSAEDLESGSLFFYRVLGGGVACHSCKESCLGVECGEEKKCVVRGGHPKCVCAPACKDNRRTKGPVCGTDSRSYRNVCRLRKRACRKRTTSLAVSYHGFCQSSCDKIVCPSGKYCLLDQNLSPHCVRCISRCGGTAAGRPVCGADGVTYPNTCMLRQTACRRGKAIPVAYKGRCKELASCGSVRCRERQACLVDTRTGRPRCVTCATHCSTRRAHADADAVRPTPQHGPLCGSNNRTYSSWCHMLRDSCATGFVIDTAFPGRCIADGVSILDNTVTHDLYGNHYEKS